ncbi:hypothetical protein J6590_108318 [Homalodisca vitripennis]|nr:hypothetical protein J6590_108318 [Homalodisca vitripennis]
MFVHLVTFYQYKNKLSKKFGLCMMGRQLTTLKWCNELWMRNILRNQLEEVTCQLPTQIPRFNVYGLTLVGKVKRLGLCIKTPNSRGHDATNQNCCSMNNWRRDIKGCRKLQLQGRTLFGLQFEHL